MTGAGAAPHVLAVRELRSGFDRRPVLHGVSLDVEAGEVVAVVGLNGAGKSVLAKTIGGLIPATGGSISLAGTDVTRWSPRRRVRAGLAQLTQRRGLVAELSVEDNLRLGAYAAGVAEPDLSWLQRFPVLRERWDQAAGTLSGGEQAMLAVVRSLLSRPKVLVADEPSAGLSPAVLDDLGAALTEVAASGTALLLIEQNLRFARSLASRLVVLEGGAVVADEPSDQVDDRRLGRLLGFTARSSTA